MLGKALAIFIAVLAYQIAISSQQENVEANNLVEPTYECKIYSDPHRQYLHAKFKLFGWSRSIGMFKEGLESTKTTFNNNDESGVWLFELVPERANTFYIRNSKYSDEYLMGSYTFQEWIFKKKNRVVHTQKMDNRNDELFMWELSKCYENVPDLVYLRNVELNQYMRTRMHYSSIASSNGRLSSEMSLLVGLSQESQPYNEEFEWLLICRNKILPKLD